MASSNLHQELADLAELDLEQLRGRWRSIDRMRPPKLSREMLLRAIAYQLQEAAHGGLPPVIRRKLTAAAIPAGADLTPILRLKPGVTLLREWHGVAHQFEVVENGFLHAGQRYRSLTRIAKLITGAHWSGPRFFGLNKAASARRQH